MNNTIKINDEPILDDYIGHYELLEQIIKTLCDCDPPYVLGISGSWGSGKTSLLRKLWATAGGHFKNEQLSDECKSCLKKSQKEMKLAHKWVVIWFNPWQHQYEANPLIALLHEIRAQYSLYNRARSEAAKLKLVSTYSLLDTLGNAANKLSLGVVSSIDVDKIQKRGEKYETQHFDTPLTSQTFRHFFEQAIDTAIGKNARLLICIDDLDRCEGEVAYRLLESLKLFLNARNCVYVIGMDQAHLEQSLTHALPDGDDTRIARNYLDKMIQDRFVLPIPQDIEKYLGSLLDKYRLKTNYFGLFKDYEAQHIVDVISKNLPHNPRKIKLFFAAWSRYLSLLYKQQYRSSGYYSWQLSIILTYLAVYEEPIYRAIEIEPQYYLNTLVPFCKGEIQGNSQLKDFLLPSDQLSGELNSSELNTVDLKAETENYKHPQESNIFWIARLINDVTSKTIPNTETIKSHLINSRYIVTSEALR